MTRGPEHLPPRPPAGIGRWVALALLGLVVASFASLDLQWGQFLSRDALVAMGHFVASFFPPQLGPAFLAQVARGAAETLAMSLLGTVLAVAGGLLLALPASLPRRDAASQAVHASARLLLNLLRSVPELVWASLLLVLAGLGPLPGTLALALHTTGVLGRLLAETLENADPAPAAALRLRGQGPARVFWWAVWPQILPQLVAYSLYRWENNIRAAAVLGIVGAGGLGQRLSVHLGLFQMPETCTVLGAMIALVVGVDGLSALSRRALMR